MVTAVKIARILNNDSQQELADFIGCKRATLANKENGKIPFSLEECKKVSERYGISINAIANSKLAKERLMEALQA